MNDAMISVLMSKLNTLNLRKNFSTGNSATVLKPGGESNQRQGGSEFDAPYSFWNPTQLLTSDYLAVSQGKLQAQRTKTRSEETGQAFESKIAAAARYLAGNVPEMCLLVSALIPQLLIPVNRNLAYIFTFP